MAIIEEFNGTPAAYAEVRGSERYPEIYGMVYFFDEGRGSVVLAEIYNLPDEETGNVGRFFGFHIHEGSTCTGPSNDPFADTLIHYSPEYAEHPQHVGDLPVVLSSNGMAWIAVYTGRFIPEQVIGRTIVVHDHPDDFRSQPFGHAGEKIACGEIKRWGTQFTANILGEPIIP